MDWRDRQHCWRSVGIEIEICKGKTTSSNVVIMAQRSNMPLVQPADGMTQRMTSVGQDKGSRTIEYIIHVFDGTNYVIWKRHTENILEALNLLDIVKEHDDNRRYEERKARTLLTSALNEENQMKVISCKTAAEIWSRLEAIYENKTSFEKLNLLGKLHSYKITSALNIATAIGEIDSIAAKLVLLGEDISEDFKISVILRALPDSFRTFKSIWKCTPESERTVDNLLTRVMAEVEDNERVEENSAYIASDLADAVKRPRDRAQTRQLSSDVVCYRCRRTGHIARNCPVDLCNDQEFEEFAQRINDRVHGRKLENNAQEQRTDVKPTVLKANYSGAHRSGVSVRQRPVVLTAKLRQRSPEDENDMRAEQSPAVLIAHDKELILTKVEDEVEVGSAVLTVEDDTKGANNREVTREVNSAVLTVRDDKAMRMGKMNSSTDDESTLVLTKNDDEMAKDEKAMTGEIKPAVLTVHDDNIMRFWKITNPRDEQNTIILTRNDGDVATASTPIDWFDGIDEEMKNANFTRQIEYYEDLEAFNERIMGQYQNIAEQEYGGYGLYYIRFFVLLTSMIMLLISIETSMLWNI